MKNIKTEDSMSGGEERPLTASANEENRSEFVDLINLSNYNKEIKN